MAIASQWQCNLKYTMPSTTVDAIQKLHAHSGAKYEAATVKRLVEERIRLLEAGLPIDSPHLEGLTRLLSNGPDLGSVKLMVLLDIVTSLDEEGLDAALCFFRDTLPDVFQAKDSLTGTQHAGPKRGRK